MPKLLIPMQTKERETALRDALRIAEVWSVPPRQRTNQRQRESLAAFKEIARLLRRGLLTP